MQYHHVIGIEDGTRGHKSEGWMSKLILWARMGLEFPIEFFRDYLMAPCDDNPFRASTPFTGESEEKK